MLARQTKTRQVRGFTLTEVAIVLGIVGLILGAVWVAAASVYDNMRIKRTNEAILQTVQGVRSLYAAGNSTGAADTDVTSDMIAAGVVPRDMRLTDTSTDAINPWSSAGGSFKVKSNGSNFGLVFTNLPKNACVNLLVSNSQQAQGTGLVGAASGETPSSAATTIAPITAGSAATTCADANANTITLTFSLKT